MEAVVEYLPPLKTVPRVKLKGEVDIYTVATLKNAVQLLLDEGHYDLIMDLTDVIYIDSTGLGTLVGIYRRCREKNGKIYLICPSPQVQKVFKTTGLSQLFTFFENEADFQQALKEKNNKKSGGKK